MTCVRSSVDYVTLAFGLVLILSAALLWFVLVTTGAGTEAGDILLETIGLMAFALGVVFFYIAVEGTHPPQALTWICLTTVGVSFLLATHAACPLFTHTVQ